MVKYKGFSRKQLCVWSFQLDKRGNKSFIYVRNKILGAPKRATETKVYPVWIRIPSG